MGIPAYFKHLTDTHPGLLALILRSLTGETINPSHLYLDLNCAIYHCVRKLQHIKPYNPLKRIEWEQALCDNVFEYIQTLVTFVEPTKQLYIAIDGVVPMAKMRQQRQRRFKGAYLRNETACIAERINFAIEPQWDTNAITPGTEFMDMLSKTLSLSLAKLYKIPSVILSDSNEPGEGEHKIMYQIRNSLSNSVDYHVVYGLDADLILLSMLQTADGHRMALLREAVEFGKIKLDAADKETLVYFDICRLARIMTHNLRGHTYIEPDRVRDYVFLCSLLGNDFIPHGFSLTIHDNGLERAIDIYTEVCTGDKRLICTTNNTIHYNTDTLVEIFHCLAEKENIWLEKWKKRRTGLTPMPRYSENPLEYELNVMEEWPVTQMNTELAWTLPLTDDSEEYYYDKLLGYTDVNVVMDTYLTSLEWVLQYYSGHTIDTQMYYPWNIPPLWKNLASISNTELELKMIAARKKVLCNKSIYVTPYQQAAMVFPISSYFLVKPIYKHLPTTYPEYFPTEFKFYVVGRRFMWQCEPIIPMIPAALIRTI